MPYKYVIESFCDMVGASKAYGGKGWKEEAVWNYWQTKCKGKRIMNKESEYLVEKLIWNLYQIGEKRFLEWYKSSKNYLETEYDSGKLSETGSQLEFQGTGKGQDPAGKDPAGIQGYDAGHHGNPAGR
jgi:hypothetical protein